MNPAALKALLDGDIENAIVASTPGGIEEQEASGQREFVASTTLPIKCNFGTRKQFEKMGIVFGGPVDDLFCEAQLPDGWEKVPTDHSMWSELRDDKGRKRAMIFYKAAFYDRDAFLDATHRFSCGTQPVGGWGREDYLDAPIEAVVRDQEETIWTSSPMPSRIGLTGDALREWYSLKDGLREEAKDWLREHYPDWEDPTAYWD